MSLVGWAWDPPAKVVEALKRGEKKFRRFKHRQGARYLDRLSYRSAHPLPTRDELDLLRAESEGM